MSDPTRAPNPNPFLKRAKKAAEPINYGDSAEDKVEQLTRENQRLRANLAELELPETYRQKADERRKADLGFFSNLMDRMGLDTQALKVVGMAVMRRFGNATDHAELDSIVQTARLQGRHEVADRALQVKIDDLEKRLNSK